jgi:hypothetical protein
LLRPPIFLLRPPSFLLQPPLSSIFNSDERVIWGDFLLSILLFTRATSALRVKASYTLCCHCYFGAQFP